MRVLLVRHGESTWNARGLWQGRADPGLSPRGAAEVAAVARILGEGPCRGHPPAVVVSSPLRRARETAGLLADAWGVPVSEDEGFIERDVGPWSGLTTGEIDRRWPGWRTGGLRPPGWEDDGPLVTRAAAALTRVVGAGRGGWALVVTHGGLIGALARHLGGPPGRVGNLGGRWVHTGGSRTVGPPVTPTWGLGGAGAPPGRAAVR